jgi:hypothetical protein
MNKIHRIQEREHRGQPWRRQGPRLILAVLVAVVSMAFAGPGLAAAPAATICEKEGAAGKLPAGTLYCDSIENFEVSGALTDKKLNQALEVKEGTFNGFVALTGYTPIEGALHGAVAIKPSEATITVFGQPTKVGLTFEQVGESEGSIMSALLGSGNCANNPSDICVHETIPTKANIGFTSITLFGLKFPLSCKTSTPVNLPLEETLLLFEELLNGGVGSHFIGTTTFPTIRCTEFLLGSFNSALLTDLFSGEGNTYSLYVKEKA